MHTLFSEHILSPLPTPVPQCNPFELQFPSSLSNASSTASTQSSPTQNEWLTQHLQSQQRAEAEAANQTSYVSNNHRTYQVRRKDHPKLLFMGLRR